MTVLADPLTLALMLAAFLLSVLDSALKKSSAVGYLGGAFWVVGVLRALILGAGLEEMLIVLLILLLAENIFRRRGEKNK